jgi:hypothetical protein
MITDRIIRYQYKVDFERHSVLTFLISEWNEDELENYCGVRVIVDKDYKIISFKFQFEEMGTSFYKKEISEFIKENKLRILTGGFLDE